MKGSISDTLDEDEEILGSDDDEQEDPRDYTKGKAPSRFLTIHGTPRRRGAGSEGVPRAGIPPDRRPSRNT